YTHRNKQQLEGNEMNELTGRINRFGARAKDEQSLLLKVGEICRDAAATWTTRKSESINHTAFTFTVKKDGLKEKVMIVL
ncbi:hypothetical protein M783_11785, partial [Neisseria gonorrhoeae MU_NG18]